MNKQTRRDAKARMDYCKERDKAFLSLDEKKIRAFCKKWKIEVPGNQLAFWASVHKAICNMNAANVKQKAYSAMWLIEHGFKVDIST